VEAHRHRSEDGLEIGAWLIRPTEKRPVVLLLHGNGASRSSFSSLISFLAKEGCGALAISLRAHGDSMGDVNDFGVGAAQDVVAAVAFLERELPGRKIIIVGESLGSSAALFAAKAASTRVQGYLFAAPFDSLDQAIWNRCENRLLPPFSHAAYAGLVLWGPAFLPESVGFIRPMDHLVEIPETVPVVFFASEDDRYARLDQVRSMAERIRSHASLITVKGGSHGRFLALHAEEYRRAILDLVVRAEAEPAPLSR
jgi:pimeloyl-ACP methyl ester carboxylesterase